MVDHLSIGARSLKAAKRFYDHALKPLGYTCLSKDAESLGYGNTRPQFWINQTDWPLTADERSSVHFCFDASSRSAVEAFHRAALAAGGRDNGKPGLRPDYDSNYFMRPLSPILTVIDWRPCPSPNRDRGLRAT